MKVRRINDKTISCIITPEDLREHGLRLDDLFERKKEAVDFIRSSVAEAARSENFNLEGALTTMRVSVLPDHSLSLLITREDSNEGAMEEVRRIARGIFESIAAQKAQEEGNSGNESADRDPSENLMKALLADAAADTDSGEADEKESESEEGGREDIQDAYMFSFYSVRDAMDCCRLFADAGPLESSLYYLQEDETYFLILRRLEGTPSGFARRVLSANEFGELVTSNEQYISFVTEHGMCIARGHAVEMFMDVMPGAAIPRIRSRRTARNGD